MKQTFILPVLALFIIASVAMVSAITPICATIETTYVSGLITDATNGNALVNGADVTVTCNGNVKTTTSAADGSYSVEYAPGECDSGDIVQVSATYDSLSGEEAEEVTEELNQIVGDCLQVIINVACVNVPLVPEFGLIVGSLTLVSAVGIFFFVRRK